MMIDNKPKLIKRCKITHGNTVYNKITHLSIYADDVYFSNSENDTTSVNIECKLNDVKIEFGSDK